MTTYSLSDYDSDVLTLIKISLYTSKSYLKILSDNMDTIKAAKSASNWITGTVFSIANDKKIEINENNIPKDSLAYLITEFEKKVLTRNKAESILRES